MSYLRKVRRGHSRFHCSWAKARSSDNASDCQCCHSSLLLGCSRCNLKDYSGAAAIVPTCHGGQNLNVARPWPALERFQHLNLGSSRSLSYRVEEEEQLEWPTKFGLDAIAQVWTWQRSLRNPAESLRMWWVTTRTMYLGSPPMMFSIGRKPQTWPSKDWFLYAVHWNHSTQLGQRHSNTSRMRLTEATKYNSVVVARCGMWSECRIVTCSSAWLRVTEYTLNIAKFKIIQYTPTSTMCIYMYIYTWSPPNKRKKTLLSVGLIKWYHKLVNIINCSGTVWIPAQYASSMFRSSSMCTSKNEKRGTILKPASGSEKAHPYDQNCEPFAWKCMWPF